MKNVFKRLLASVLICTMAFGGIAFSADLPVPTTSVPEVDAREDSYFSGEYKEAHPVLAADMELSGFNPRNPDNALYLTSPTIPQDAINFAQEEFPRVSETLTAEELGFDPAIAQELRISKGFIIKNADGSNDDTYYFPVTYDGSVKGIMAIYQESGEYASL